VPRRGGLGDAADLPENASRRWLAMGKMEISVGQLFDSDGVSRSRVCAASRCWVWRLRSEGSQCPRTGSLAPSAVDSQPALVVVSIVSDLTVGVIPNCIAAMGEKLGWREFLVPGLAKITSFKNVAWISGLIWALYHFPVILGADYLGAAPRWPSVLCFTFQIMSLSFIYAWAPRSSDEEFEVVIMIAAAIEEMHGSDRVPI
jgi:Type II CAAX prenyl endopeptidase Rce1-like